MSRLAHRDARTLFERAWSHGVRVGLITPVRREALIQEATRAIRKIASVLGTEHLRADLERAMRSMLGLIGLHLERVSGGDVDRAARAIAEHGLLFHTRSMSRAIKQALAVVEAPFDPESDAADRRVVADWASRTLAEVDALEQDALRQRAERAAARALVRLLEGPVEDLDDTDPDALIMTALLILAGRRPHRWIEDTAGFERLLKAIRQRPAMLDRLPVGIPEPHRSIAGALWSLRAPRILEIVTNPAYPLHRLAAGDPADSPLLGLLWQPGDALHAVDAHGQSATDHWRRLTRGTRDPLRLLMVMLRGVSGIADRAPFSARTAERLLRTLLADPPDDARLDAWLDANAPHQAHEGLRSIWQEFWDERADSLDADATAADYLRFARDWLPMRPSTARSAS